MQGGDVVGRGKEFHARDQSPEGGDGTAPFTRARYGAREAPYLRQQENTGMENSASEKRCPFSETSFRADPQD